LGILADSHSKSDQEIARKNAMLYYGTQDNYEGTIGLKWRILWPKLGYSRTVVSYNQMRYLQENYETSSGYLMSDNKSIENIINLNNHNYFRFNDTHSFEFGFNIKQYLVKYDTYYGTYLDPLGQIVPSLYVNLNESATKLALYANYIVKPWQNLTANLGLRGDYFTVTKNSYLSPRLSFSYNLSDRTSVNGSVGLYFQHIPLNLMAQNSAYKNLSDMRSEQLVLGLSHLISENTRISVETYRKKYKNFPLDPNQRGLFVIDELYYHYGFFTQHKDLNDYGEATSEGIEIIIQKKLVQDFYGMISGSYFRSRYRDSNKIWRDRVYDNRIVFNLEGGYKPNNLWEFSIRWIFAGGIPYTPFDQEKSRQLNQGIFDDNRIHGERLPAYHSLNIRADRRFHFSKSNIILYISIWNAYNRKNIASYYWNSVINEQDEIYQWGFLPIFGVEYEF